MYRLNFLPQTSCRIRAASAQKDCALRRSFILYANHTLRQLFFILLHIVFATSSLPRRVCSHLFCVTILSILAASVLSWVVRNRCCDIRALAYASLASLTCMRPDLRARGYFEPTAMTRDQHDA